MSDAPFLDVSSTAMNTVRRLMGEWENAGHDVRDIALAMMAQGHAALLILDGRADQIALYEKAAQIVTAQASAEGNG